MKLWLFTLSCILYTSSTFGQATVSGSGKISGNASISITPPSGGTFPGKGQTGWFQLSGMQMSANSFSVCPAGAQGGAGGQCGQVFIAWSGGACGFDASNILHCFVLGGGHTDYSGNEVYDYNFTAKTLTRLTNPDPASCPGSDSTNGRPDSRHTYDNMVWDSVHHKLLMTANGSLATSGSSPTTCGGAKFWIFDPANLGTNNGWTGITPSGAGIFTDGSGIAESAYNNTTGLAIFNDGSGNYYQFNPATNTTTSLGAHSQGYNSGYVGAVDELAGKFVLAGGQGSTQLGVQTVSGPPTTFTDLSGSAGTCSGFASTTYPGMDYDQVSQTVIGYPQSAGNTIYLLNSSTGHCTTEVWAGGPSAPSPATQGLFGRWEYVPYNATVADGDFWVYLGNYNENPWILRRHPVPGQRSFAERSAGSIVATNFTAFPAWTSNGTTGWLCVSGLGCSGAHPPTQDCTTAINPDGACAVHFTLIQGDTAGGAGIWREYFGGTPLAPGGTVYVSYTRIGDATSTNTNWPNISSGSGMKFHIIYQDGASSCTGQGWVWETFAFNPPERPGGYGSCGTEQMWLDNSGNLTSNNPKRVQQNSLTPDAQAYECSSANSYVDATCLFVEASVPQTYYFKFHYDAVTNSNNSSIMSWEADPNQSMRQFQFIPNFSITKTETSPNISVLDLMTYVTGLSGGTYGTANVWYKDLIISSSPIPPPTGTQPTN